ncbi:MAG: 4'-phosphopantetheinyl transferase superfamily protein [Bacteroidetes bacterium]|nr:4'-phosphopantetheinyl transferase superfamily protein [Bacteroidota bacterium]HET6243479.1 4'-phosphopantetheinyl transferase superfamily protein [Bacteroidia bacterium]
MSLYSINNINSCLNIGLWEITETRADLISEINLSSIELQQLEQINLETKKIQWLSVRVLLKKMLGKGFQILYSKTGKPYLKDSTLKISISHTESFVSLIINEKEETGVDIEKANPKVERIKNKFLSLIELSDIQNSGDFEKLLVYWGAKESLYKVYGEKELTFKENLFIPPFKFKKSGTIEGRIIKGNVKKNYLLNYEKIQGHILVYVLEEINLQNI